MKTNLLPILTSLVIAATVSAASGGTFPKMEDIYAGAAFAHGRDSSKPDIVLVETYQDRFYYGNSWDVSPFKLYSSFHDSQGGTRDEVCADLRASDYYYIGKYMEIVRPSTTNVIAVHAQTCERDHCDTPAPMPMPFSFTYQHPIITLPYIAQTNYWPPQWYWGTNKVESVPSINVTNNVNVEAK